MLTTFCEKVQILPSVYRTSETYKKSVAKLIATLFLLNH